MTIRSKDGAKQLAPKCFCYKRNERGDLSIARAPYQDRTAQQKGGDTDGPRTNQDIKARQIRVVDADGEMRGVMTVQAGIQLAEEAGLDLVEVSPNAEPPVCKVLDYGKYRYEQQKQLAQARKKQKTIELKEVKLRPNIDDHDFEIKMRNARSFLEAGDKVKVTLRFRGREVAHQNIAQEVLRRVRENLDDVGKVVTDPSFEGRQIVMILAAR